MPPRLPNPSNGSKEVRNQKSGREIDTCYEQAKGRHSSSLQQASFGSRIRHDGTPAR